MGSGDRGRQWGKCPCSKISSPSAKDISLVGRVRIKVASHYHLWPVTCSSISSQRNEVEYHFEGTLQAYVFSAGVRTVKDFASASRGNLTNHVLQSCIPFSPSCPVGKACSACRCTSGIKWHLLLFLFQTFPQQIHLALFGCGFEGRGIHNKLCRPCQGRRHIPAKEEVTCTHASAKI